MRRTGSVAASAIALVFIALSGGRATGAFQSAPPPPAPGTGKLIVYGDMALFQPPGHPENCILRNRFKRGEPVGWRMFVADPSTGKREESAQLVVHLNVSGRTIDIPMRYRATAAQPGALSYTVTATDRFGRTARFAPFINLVSQITIVE